MTSTGSYKTITDYSTIITIAPHHPNYLPRPAEAIIPPVPMIIRANDSDYHIELAVEPKVVKPVIVAESVVSGWGSATSSQGIFMDSILATSEFQGMSHHGSLIK